MQRLMMCRFLACCRRFGVFPETLVAIYIAQVLQGLAYLHDQGVVHRDIKGANILTTKDVSGGSSSGGGSSSSSRSSSSQQQPPASSSSSSKKPVTEAKQKQPAISSR